MLKEKTKVLPEQNENSINNVIIAGKTYKINELNYIFTVNALMNASKEELYKYWQMAIETGIKRYRDIVDYIFNKNFPKYE